MRNGRVSHRHQPRHGTACKTLGWTPKVGHLKSGAGSALKPPIGRTLVVATVRVRLIELATKYQICERKFARFRLEFDGRDPLWADFLFVSLACVHSAVDSPAWRLARLQVCRSKPTALVGRRKCQPVERFLIFAPDLMSTSLDGAMASVRRVSKMKPFAGSASQLATIPIRQASSIRLASQVDSGNNDFAS